MRMCTQHLLVYRRRAAKACSAHRYLVHPESVYCEVLDLVRGAFILGTESACVLHVWPWQAFHRAKFQSRILYENGAIHLAPGSTWTAEEIWAGDHTILAAWRHLSLAISSSVP